MATLTKKESFISFTVIQRNPLLNFMNLETETTEPIMTLLRDTKNFANYDNSKYTGCIPQTPSTKQHPYNTFKLTTEYKLPTIFSNLKPREQINYKYINTSSMTSKR